jgi:hypothetical protein
MSDYSYTLPSGLVVGFRPPSYQDRKEALKNFDPKSGVAPEELLVASCIQSINNKSYDNEWDADYASRFDGMTVKDQTIFVTVFLQMFTADEAEKSKAVEDAKKLLAGNMTASPKAKA